MKSSFKFAIWLLIILLAVFGLHVMTLKSQNIYPYHHQIEMAYVINYILAAMGFFLLIFLKKKRSNVLGFVFMGISLIKFTFFFVFFYPDYKADGFTEATEFAAFFTPYAVCLIFETGNLIKILNRE